MSAVMRPLASFEPMTEADLAQVMAIEQAIYAFPWTIGNFRDSLRAGYSCLVHRVDDHPDSYPAPGGGRAARMAGYAVMLVAAGEAHLLNLSVAKAYQRRGHGSLILSRLIRLSRDHGAQRLFLEVRPSNQAGRKLYARHGFAEAGVRRNYYPSPEGREDALVLSLPL